MSMTRTIGICCVGLMMACGSVPEKEEVDLLAERGTSAFVAKPEGNLVIIGGGGRPASLMATMAQMAERPDAYALVFPQSSAEPDSSFFYFAKDLKPHTDMPIVMVSDGYLRNSLVDSVRQAALIFITGGDQNRFVESVHSSVRKAIKEAYYSGATIGGTSAGAALMSATMITGDQREWPLYESTYRSLIHGNAIYDQGLGLLDSVVVDQHFVARSRYNRLISALADTGLPYAAGIDEATALVVTPSYCTAVGESQVVLMKRPAQFVNRGGHIGLSNMQVDIYLEGDTFNLNLWK